MGSARRPIAEVFLDNAEGFLWAADYDHVVSGEAALQSICVALDLALKAYLIGYGWTDDQTRRLIRHNLPRAVQHATRLGFVIPKRCKTLASFAGPYYQVHALDEFFRQHPRTIKVEETAAEILGLIQWIHVDLDLRSAGKGASAGETSPGAARH